MEERREARLSQSPADTRERFDLPGQKKIDYHLKQLRWKTLDGGHFNHARQGYWAQEQGDLEGWLWTLQIHRQIWLGLSFLGTAMLINKELYISGFQFRQ